MNGLPTQHLLKGSGLKVSPLSFTIWLTSSFPDTSCLATAISQTRASVNSSRADSCSDFLAPTLAPDTAGYVTSKSTFYPPRSQESRVRFEMQKKWPVNISCSNLALFQKTVVYHGWLEKATSPHETGKLSQDCPPYAVAPILSTVKQYDAIPSHRCRPTSKGLVLLL